MQKHFLKFSLLYSDTERALEIVHLLSNSCEFVEPEKSDVIVVVGGDGQMLHEIHQYMHLKIPFYGINAGSVGFLMNDLLTFDLIKNLSKTKVSSLHLLDTKVRTVTNELHMKSAINEVSIFRKTNQAAKFRIFVDELADTMSEEISNKYCFKNIRIY